jgi:hypothetical protein
MITVFLTVAGAGLIISTRSLVHCRTAIKLDVARIGQRTSAEGLPGSYGDKLAVTLSFDGICQTASDYLITQEPGRADFHRLPPGGKKLASRWRVTECNAHAKTCQLSGTTAAGDLNRQPSDGGRCRADYQHTFIGSLSHGD